MTFDISNPVKPTITKDPDATLDYGWDFTDLIDVGDTISSVVFTVQSGSGLIITQQSIAGMIAYAWLSGGVAGSTWSVTCEYTTAQGRINDRTLFFKIKDL